VYLIEIIPETNLLILSVPNRGYSRNALCTRNEISTV